MQKLSEEPLRLCPECGEESLHKKLTAAAFHLKGTGWYETDFKDKTKKGDKDTEKGQAGDAKKHKKDDRKTSEKKSTESTSDSGTKTGGTKSTESAKSDSA